MNGLGIAPVVNQIHEWYHPIMSNTKVESWFETTVASVNRYFFFSSIALIVIFAWMEPAGAAGIGFFRGLIFWTIQISILIPLLIFVQQASSRYVTHRTSYAPTSYAPWIQTALTGVVGALLFVPIGYLLDTAFAIPEDELSTGIVGGLIDETGGVVVPVTVTWLALNAPWILQLDFSKKRSEVCTPTTDSTPPPSLPPGLKTTPFLQELKSRAPGELISISSELHYVRVVTTDTETMFIYNLKDAIEELPSDAGVQIHRSHWVSKAHVNGLSRKDGNFECTLSNGKSLPVSRRKYAEVKAMLGL
jgi:hypothetical protein